MNAHEHFPFDPRLGLSERMATAARDLQAQHDPAATYEMATDLAMANIAGCHAAGLSMVRCSGRKVVNWAATEPSIRLADELQTELDQGPCLDAIALEDTTHCVDLSQDPRWPEWGRRVAEETDMHSVLSFHLFTHADTLGALNLYSRDRDGFSDHDHHDGLVLAAHIAIAVAAARSVHDLGRAMATRTVIGQATGILIERYKVTPDRAFAILARFSSQEEMKLRDIAKHVVDTGHLPGQE